MLTDKQKIKLKQLSEMYYNNQDAFEEINTEKLIKILRDNKWNMSKSFKALIVFHNEIIEEKRRIWNLSKNVIKPFDNVGYIEIWSEFYKCPSCGCKTLCRDTRDDYCKRCGIEVDWSEIDKI